MSVHVEAVHDEHHDHPVEHTYQAYPGGLDPPTMGLIIFLASEVALFGSFFLWYGHSRLVRGIPWPPEGFEIPADSTSINTAILVASSFTCEFALISLLRGNRAGLKWFLVATFGLGAAFLGLQVHEYMSIGFTPQDTVIGSIFFGLTGLHGAHVGIGLLLLGFCIIRAWRGHFEPDSHPGLLITSVYWHFVDIVWVILYTVVYLLPTHPI